MSNMGRQKLDLKYENNNNFKCKKGSFLFYMPPNICKELL